VKYGYKDLRFSLERASARETAMRVAAGAICKHFLAQFGIIIGGYVASIGNVRIDFGEMSYADRFARAEESDVRCPIIDFEKNIHDEIEQTIHGKNTLGGVIEIAALNVPVGLGSFVQWDKRLDAKLAMAAVSVPAIKGVEIGDAFENATLSGTQAHDAMTLEQQNIHRLSNRAGGIEGGISNGQPIVIRAAMKPIATTLTPQQTVDLAKGQESPTKYERSDFCPVPRAVPILEAMAAFVLADALIEKLGGDSINEMKPRFELLRKARLEDLPMDNTSRILWE
jgi:chorismate synthase